MITYTQILQFVTVVHNKSITKAAEELFVAQPAISSTIKKIENVLNVQLFTYENKQLRLTEAGEKVYKIFSEILALYSQLDTIQHNNASNITTRRQLSYYASPSIHDYITPRLELFDAFPQLDFSIYTCNGFDSFCNEAQKSEDVFAIFFVPATVSYDFLQSHNFTVETITAVSTTLLTSNKNTSAIINRRSCTLEEIKELPLIRCLGSDLSIQNHLSEIDLNFVMEVSDAKHVSDILDKRPHLYTLGTNIFYKQRGKKNIAIPIEDAPSINLVFIYKNNTDHQEIYTRISAMLHSLYNV